MRKEDKGGGVMERLTKRDEKGFALLITRCGDGCKYGSIDTCNYECDKDFIEKLAEYEDLEEQGLLLRLPCNVGASVYMVAQDCGGDTLDCMRGDCEGCPYLYSFVEENTFEVYMRDEIGKTVFLTQSEAEQKLKEMESGNNGTME